MTAPSNFDVRMEVRSWISDNWNPEMSLVEWRGRLADSGWACPSWPSAWFGCGLPSEMDQVVRVELEQAGAPGRPVGRGMDLAAPTILRHGSDEMKRRLLRPILTGESTWCQLFSEPGSGSDLAGLTTRAQLVGNEFLVTGQKVWNTNADLANYGMLLARTDWGVPKHQGITCLALPMQQSGVEVRPLRQMNGHASFNEVFLTDARVPADHIIGEINGGWAPALTMLAQERSASRSLRPCLEDGSRSRAVREAQEELARYNKTYEWYPQRAGRPDLVLEMARQKDGGDRAVRQAVAKVVTLQRIIEWTAARAEAAPALGRPVGPEGSLGKLNAGRLARVCRRPHASERPRGDVARSGQYRRRDGR